MVMGWTRWLLSGEGIIVWTSNGSSFEDSLRIKARPVRLEGMVKIVERSAMDIRSRPVRVLGTMESNWIEVINHGLATGGRVIHNLRA
jgi:hypothetical protein